MRPGALEKRFLEMVRAEIKKQRDPDYQARLVLIHVKQCALCKQVASTCDTPPEALRKCAEKCEELAKVINRTFNVLFSGLEEDPAEVIGASPVMGVLSVSRILNTAQRGKLPPDGHVISAAIRTMQHMTSCAICTGHLEPAEGPEGVRAAIDRCLDECAEFSTMIGNSISFLRDILVKKAEED